MFKEKIYKKSKVLLTSPHTTYTFREENGKWILHKKEKYIEKILEFLSKRNNWSFLCYKDHFCIDPNAHTFNYKINKLELHPFKKRILEIAEKNKIAYLIDLHGMKDSYGVEVCIGTPLKINESTKKRINFICKNLRFSINKPFSAQKKETITKFGCRIGIKSFQIELSLKFRENKENWITLERIIKSILFG